MIQLLQLLTNFKRTVVFELLRFLFIYLAVIDLFGINICLAKLNATNGT